MKIRKLNDTQLTDFDTEYVGDKLWVSMKKCIDQDFSDRPFSFLDLGGGNGIFTDRVLGDYPNARATILDNSEFLLSKNRKSDRKRIICESVENMGDLFRDKWFDIIFMNWILHHLIGGSYLETLTNVKNVLKVSSKKILNDQGRISILENMYDGLVFDNLPSHIIYHLTSCKRLSKLMKRLGANTAGIGVCFRSKKVWANLAENAGMKVIQYSHNDKWSVQFFRRLFLHIGNIRVGHFWLGKA